MLCESEENYIGCYLLYLLYYNSATVILPLFTSIIKPVDTCNHFILLRSILTTKLQLNSIFTALQVTIIESQTLKCCFCFTRLLPTVLMYLCIFLIIWCFFLFNNCKSPVGSGLVTVVIKLNIQLHYFLNSKCKSRCNGKTYFIVRVCIIQYNIAHIFPFSSDSHNIYRSIISLVHTYW